MKRWMIMATCALSVGVTCAADLLLIGKTGDVPGVIVVDGAVMDPKDHSKGLVNPALEAEQQRIRLRESVLDMAAVFEKMTGRKVPVVRKAPAGKRVWLWIGATDGSILATVNGKAVKGCVEPKKADAPRKLVDKPSGYGAPILFDVTDVIRNGSNDVAFFATRGPGPNELGTGGLLSPVVVFSER